MNEKPRLVGVLGSVAILATTTAIVSLSGWQQPPPASGLSQSQTEISTTITGDQPGSAPRLAVPDFLPLSSDSATVDAAKVLGRVLWDDLNFEREFPLLPRDVVSTIPVATSVATVPYARYAELNADGVVVGTVETTSKGYHVEVRIVGVRSRQAAFGQSYDGTSNVRLYAHRAADDIHKQLRGLQGVAQTKITFNSDRAGARLPATAQNRSVKEIMYADYDGENVQTVTVDKGLAITSVWSPDGRSIAYTRFPRIGVANIWIANIFEGQGAYVTSGSENMMPAWSPDGTKIAFTSWRTGNAEIFVAGRDGSNPRNLTNNPAIDVTPTWSPNGRQIAFTSNRTGSQQIWVIDADGVGQATMLTRESQADRATWSFAPLNQIAYAAQTGPGWDIKVMDLANRTVRQLTFGEGSNESPAFAPNGRHIAFTSTRAGKQQIFTIGWDGNGVRQITKDGNNQMANWSPVPVAKN